MYVKSAGDAIYWRRSETAGGVPRFAAEAVLWALNSSLRMPGAPFVDAEQTFRSIVRHGDMNGDGRVDLLMRMLAQYDYCDGSGCGSTWVRYWFVLASTGTSLAPQYGLDGNAEPVLADFNADLIVARADHRPQTTSDRREVPGSAGAPWGAERRPI